MNKLAFDLGGALFGGTGGFTQLSDVGKIVSIIISNAVIIAGIILLFLIIFAGYSFISGAGSGNSQKVAQGRSAATAAIIGFVVIFIAYWIAVIIQTITGVHFIN